MSEEGLRWKFHNLRKEREEMGRRPKAPPRPEPPPPPPQPTVNLLGITMPKSDPNPQDKDERILLLERMLYEQWQIICDQALVGESRRRSFTSMDRRLRELGILPGVTHKTK